VGFICNPVFRRNLAWCPIGIGGSTRNRLHTKMLKLFRQTTKFGSSTDRITSTLTWQIQPSWSRFVPMSQQSHIQTDSLFRFLNAESASCGLQTNFDISYLVSEELYLFGSYLYQEPETTARKPTMRYFTVYISDYQRPQRGLNRVPLKQHSEIRQLRPDETQLPARLQYLARTMT
jgi:hypothetical protein